MFYIGPHAIKGQAVLAPMAGITDQPFRNLCREHGAAYAVSEMVTSQTHLWQSRKSQTRLNLSNENGLRAIQIAGNDPQQMADATRACVDAGAHIIDINMGCPAKKVCNKAAGSALLQDEGLVADILEAVCTTSLVPVTLKTRTGWDQEHRNIERIANLAEDTGISALTIHGRTRACRFNGQAEFDTIKRVVQNSNIPVIANGDICTAEQAATVLESTQAAAVMIGRGAQGNPWLFEQINHYLTTGEHLSAPSLLHVAKQLLAHLDALHRFYGAEQGVRIARKHFIWYMSAHLPKPLALDARQQFTPLQTPQEQNQLVRTIFNEQLQLPLEEEAA